MALKKNKNGTYASLASKSDVRDALNMIAKCENVIELQDAKIKAKCKIELTRKESAMTEMQDLKSTVESYVLGKEGYEDDGVKVTKVQGHRRKWNADKLAAIVPKGIFLKIVDYVPNADKINALVSEGKLDLKKIDKAYEETPNAAYVKWTWKGESADHEDEASSLAAKLG